MALVGIGLLSYAYVRHILDDAKKPEKLLTIKDIGWIALFALFLALVSGVGGMFHQVLDHWAHNSKLYELFRNPWPLVYPSGGAAYSYYFGYYLVPALVSKMIGSFNETILFMWTLLGFVLGIAWIYLTLNGKVLYMFLCLGLGASPEIIAFICRQVGLNPYAYYGDVLIWMPSVLNNLRWVPNQAIPTLIVAGMLVYLVKTKGDLQEMVLPVALCLWWAVFPALLGGLLIGMMILRQWWLDGIHWPTVLGKVVGPALACLPVLSLFMSHNSIPISGFLWEFNSPTGFISRYVVEVLLNISLFYLAFRIFYKNQGATEAPRVLFYLTMGLMLLMPFYRMGVYNDFMVKGIQPYLLITGLLLLVPLSEKPSYLAAFGVAKKSVLNFTVLGLLLLSATSSIRTVAQSVELSPIISSLFPDQKIHKPIPYDQYPTIYSMLVDKYSKADGEQYLGKKGSIYERYVR